MAAYRWVKARARVFRAGCAVSRPMLCAADSGQSCGLLAAVGVVAVLIDCATRPTGACACLVADAGVLGWRGGLPDACRRDSGSTIGPRSGAENMSWLRQEQSQVHFTFFHFGRVFNRSSLTRLAVAMAVLCTCACSRRLPSAAARFLRLRSVMQACMCPLVCACLCDTDERVPGMCVPL